MMLERINHQRKRAGGLEEIQVGKDGVLDGTHKTRDKQVISVARVIGNKKGPCFEANWRLLAFA
jgi:hypothetical protein